MTAKPVRWATAAAATIAAQAAPAAEIPIEIRWTGIQPSSVNLSSETGLQPLDYDQQRRLYVGTVSIAGGRPQRRTVIISYGTFNHPVDLRVHRVLPRISFGVEHRPQASCTNTRVQTYGRRSSNLADAINRTVGAGQLLSIERPNDCDAALRLNAAQARYRQNVRMGQLSQGLFLVNPEIEQEYRELATREGSSVERELSAYAAAEARLEAVQLIGERRRAQASADFATAADINLHMQQRVASSPEIERAFAVEGIDRFRLIEDGSYLNARAVRQAVRDARD